MYSAERMIESINELIDGVKFLNTKMEYSHDKHGLDILRRTLLDMEDSIQYYFEELERIDKQRYSLETCSDESLYMLEAISW